MLFKKVPMKRYGLFPFLNLNGLVAHYIEFLVVGWKVTLKGYCSGPGSKRQRVVLHCCPTKHMSSKEGENLLNYSNSCNDIFVRWYILLLFSMVALLQDTIWNTWGPIDHTAIFLYGWYGIALKTDFGLHFKSWICFPISSSHRSHDLVALLANYGSILYILAFFPVVYILNRSLRGAMLMCMWVFTILQNISIKLYLSFVFIWNTISSNSFVKKRLYFSPEVSWHWVPWWEQLYFKAREPVYR